MQLRSQGLVAKRQSPFAQRGQQISGAELLDKESFGRARLDVLLEFSILVVTNGWAKDFQQIPVVAPASNPIVEVAM